MLQATFVTCRYFPFARQAIEAGEILEAFETAEDAYGLLRTISRSSPALKVMGLVDDWHVYVRLVGADDLQGCFIFSAEMESRPSLCGDRDMWLAVFGMFIVVVVCNGWRLFVCGAIIPIMCTVGLMVRIHPFQG